MMVYHVIVFVAFAGDDYGSTGRWKDDCCEATV